MKYRGILLAVASLPSPFGIGDMGTNAYKFIDWLKAHDYNLWQILPLNPLGFCNSPYQPYSSFAGDEIYLSTELLVAENLLSQADISHFIEESSYIDYDEVRRAKSPILHLAYRNFKQNQDLQCQLSEFIQANAWLNDYAVFMAFKKANQLKPWNLWPLAHKNWIKDRQLDLSAYADAINYELFVQFIFFRQWFKLKEYANQQGIAIMGDIPIYLGHDSVEVWQNQELFLLDADGNPSVVAGVPPDYFSATGQRWGNPIYNWEQLAVTKFSFWINRLRETMRMFDIIRLDHFRAFDSYWQIPISCPTAVEGSWELAPGYALFEMIFQELPSIKLVVEDLGDLRPQVLELRDYYQLAGMQIFQLEFNPRSDNAEFEQTHNTVLYTGTHDNNTLRGWYKSLSRWQRKLLKTRFKAKDSNIVRKILKYMANCNANYIIIPFQDILDLDETARINFPGKVGSPNWEWKLIKLV